VLWNNATQASATWINLSHLTQDGVDIDLLLATLTPGQVLLLQDRNNSANYQRWLVSGATTNFNPGAANSYWQVPVTLLASGGTGTTNFPNNHELLVMLPAPVSAGAPIDFRLNGPLPGYPTDTTAPAGLPASGSTATFDVAIYIERAMVLTDLRAVQRVPGTAGTTSCELLRRRGGVFLSLGICSIATVAGFDTATAAITDPVALAGDILTARLRSVQSSEPSDLILQVKGT